jgi:hypothetical protein
LVKRVHVWLPLAGCGGTEQSDHGRRRLCAHRQRVAAPPRSVMNSRRLIATPEVLGSSS